MAIHAAQRVGSRQEQALAAARGRAAHALTEARAAGLATTDLAQALRRDLLPSWDRTAVSLLVGGGSLLSRMTTETGQLNREVASLGPAIARWRAGMASIEKARGETRAQLQQVARTLPALQPQVASRERQLALRGEVPLSRQAKVLSELTSASAWAGQLSITAQKASQALARDNQLISQAEGLKLAVGTASQQIQQAQQQIAQATSSSAVGTIVSTLDSELLPLKVNVRAADPGPGQVIVIHLAAQTLTAYLNGRQVLSTPVTTGRPGLRTPIGIDTITWEQSPYLFISPWPPGNQYYYPPSWVTWVLHFHSGGYFIHDAPWEPNSAFGPGSENGPYSSHGCVQVPHAAMQFLWNWTRIGATVVVAP